MIIILTLLAIIGTCLILYRRDKKVERFNTQRHLSLMDKARVLEEETYQRIFDYQFEQNINIQAERWFEEWKNYYNPASVYAGFDPRQGFLPLCDPSLATLNIYGGAVSKWDGSDFKSLALDKFNILKKEYIEAKNF